MKSILIDSREPDWVQKLTFGGTPVAVTMLPAGDVWVACDDDAMVCVERKTPDDFLNSLRDDRIFHQCAALREQSAWAYVLITGPFLRGSDGKVITGRITGWDWSSVQGSLLTIQEMGVGVIHAASDHDLEASITRLANRRRDVVRVPPQRVSHLLSDSESIIASLPGIGVDRLDTINAAFPLNECAYMALCALTDYDPDGWDMPGIGEGITRRIRKALGLPQGVFLSPMRRESTNNEQQQRVDDSRAA